MINNLFLKTFGINPEIESKIFKIIADQMGIEKSDLSYETKFIDLGSDSLDMIELAMEAEEVFELDEIPDEEIENIKTVGEAIDYIVCQINLK